MAGHPRAVAFLQDPRVTWALVRLVKRAGRVSDLVRFPRRKLAQVLSWLLAQDIHALKLRFYRPGGVTQQNVRIPPKENA